jgi:MFS family permease
VMQWFPEAERGLALGIRQASVPAGGLLASFTLPALAHVGLGWAFGSLAAACVVSAVSGAWLLRESGLRTPRRSAKTFRDPTLWLISFSTALLVVGQVATMSFTVLFLHVARGFSIGEGAAVYAGTLLLGLGLRVLAGHWSDRLGTRIVPLRRLALGVGATLALLALLASAATWLLIPALVLAGGIGHSWAGLPFALAAERAGTNASGAAIGLQQTAAGIGGIFGPIGFASVVAATSWRAAFLVAGVFPLIAWATLRPLAKR